MPGPYFEQNNALVPNNLSDTINIVLEMKTQNVIEFVDEKPHCVNPKGLVTKVKDGKIKHRIVFDSSRWINLHITLHIVKLSHLEKIVDLIAKDDPIST